MIWMPPPSWFVAALLAMAMHVVVAGLVFYARGWKRGAMAIPVTISLFLLSLALGVAAEIAVPLLDPAPIVLTLGAGIFAAYALLMRTPKRPNEDKGHVI